MDVVFPDPVMKAYEYGHESRFLKKNVASQYVITNELQPALADVGA